MDESDARSVLVDFAAGRASVADLTRIGIGISFEGPNLRVVDDLNVEPIQVDPGVLASALLKHANDGNEGTFARVIMALLSLHFDRLHESREGERLLDLLWDASGGRSLKRGDLRFLAKLAGTSEAR